MSPERIQVPGVVEGEHVVISNGIGYGVNELISLAENLEIKLLPASELDDAINHECWDDVAGNKLKPIDVLSFMRDGLAAGVDAVSLSGSRPELKNHIERIFGADTKHPIIITLIEGENVVLDGMHRLVKMLLDGQGSIPVKMFEKLPEEAILTKKPDQNS